MNTSKQVNAMIGLLGLLVFVLGAYFLNESSRQAEAREEILHRNIERGSRLFVNNCRTCHGLEGKGPEEGAFAPTLNQPAFWIIDKQHAEELGVEETPQGEADALRAFLRNTIACGRTGSPMPTWAQRFGGPLSDTQIDQIVTLITTPNAWEIEAEINREHMVEANETAEAVLVKPADVPSLSITEANCGQYTGQTAAQFRLRDPLKPVEPGAEPTAPGATPKAEGPQVKGLPVADFFRANCAVCHGQQRQGGVGPALVPSRLTQPDEFYQNTIANGRPGTPMPAWKQVAGLTDEEIATLVTFLKTTNP